MMNGREIMNYSGYLFSILCIIMVFFVSSVSGEISVYRDGALSPNVTQQPPVSPSLFDNPKLVALPVNVDFSGAPTQGRVPLRVLFSDLSSGNPAQWRWDFGDGSVSDMENPLHTYTVGGVYDVSLTVSGPLGSAIKVKEHYITVEPGMLRANFTADPMNGSAPLTVRFMDTSKGAVIWLWDFGDGSKGSMIPNPTHTFSKNGTYPVRLHVGNQAGGSDTITRDIIVSPYQEFTVDFTAIPQVGTAPLLVNFTGEASDEVKSWRWNLGDSTVADTPNPAHVFQHEGLYTVSLTAWDLQGNSATKRKPGYIRVQKRSPSSGAIPLYVGWNLISVPLPLSAGNDTAMIFRNIDSAGHSLFRYDTSAGGWTVLTPDANITPFAAFWIFSGRNDTIPLSFAGSSTPTPREISLGWSTIGIYGTESRMAASALESVKEQWVYCFGFAARLQQYQNAIIKGQDDQVLLSPYAGYWIYLSDPGTLRT